MICRQCGGQNSEGARFCIHCGAALQPACPNCGQAVLVGMRFCTSCGHPLQNGSPESAGAKETIKAADPAKAQVAARARISCPYCGFANRPGIRFCEQCGQPISGAGQARANARPSPVVSGTICPVCGSANRPGVGFCEQCGSGLQTGFVNAGPAGAERAAKFSFGRLILQMTQRFLVGGILSFLASKLGILAMNFLWK